MMIFRLFYFWLLGRLELRVNVGRDFQAKAMGGDTSLGYSGNATASAATTLTDSGASWTTDQWRGHVVFAGPNNSGTGSRAYGVIVSNTSTVLTIDKWYNPADPAGAAATTPNATANYVIGSGQAPAWWIALTETDVTPASGDTALTGEITTGGLSRAVATWAHTTGALTYTLTKTFTSTATFTVFNEAVFNTSRNVTGQHMVFSADVPNPPTLVSGDQLTITHTITM